MENNTNDDPQEVIKQENHEQPEDNCPMTNAWKIIGGKWKLLILNAISQECPARFGELRKKNAGYYADHTNCATARTGA